MSGFFASGSFATQLSSNVSITGGSITGVTGVAGTTAANIFSSTQANTFGTGSTGTNTASIAINGGGGSAGGAFTRYQKNGVTTGLIGHDSAINGSTLTDFDIYTANSFAVYSGNTLRATWSSTGGVDCVGEVRCDSFRIDATPSASTSGTPTFKTPVILNGSTYFMMLSTV